MKQSGQAVLMVLLVVAVALGLGISIISQSTTDVRITQQEQDAARAFNAAEAGIEQALKQITTIGSGTQSITVDSIPVEYSVTGRNYLQAQFLENETAQVILDGNTNAIVIEWVDKNNPTENPGNCGSGVIAASGQTAASLLVTVIDSSYNLKRYGVNACSLGSSNNLTDVLTPGIDQYLRRGYLPGLDADDRFVRIRPLYNLASIRATGANLPNQAYQINSSAQTQTTETKAIEVTRLEPGVPAIFDYVLFSGGHLFK